MRDEKFRVRVTSVWDRSLSFGRGGVRSFGSEATEVVAPLPDLPWEGDLINDVTASLSNIQISSRTHAEGHLAGLASRLVGTPALARRKIPAYQE